MPKLVNPTVVELARVIKAMPAACMPCEQPREGKTRCGRAARLGLLYPGKTKPVPTCNLCLHGVTTR